MEKRTLTVELTQDDFNQIFLGLDARVIDVQKRIKGDTAAWIGNVGELKKKLGHAWAKA